MSTSIHPVLHGFAVGQTVRVESGKRYQVLALRTWAQTGEPAYAVRQVREGKLYGARMNIRESQLTIDSDIPLLSALLPRVG